MLTKGGVHPSSFTTQASSLPALPWLPVTSLSLEVVSHATAYPPSLVWTIRSPGKAYSTPRLRTEYRNKSLAVCGFFGAAIRVYGKYKCELVVSVTSWTFVKETSRMSPCINGRKNLSFVVMLTRHPSAYKTVLPPDRK